MTRRRRSLERRRGTLTPSRGSLERRRETLARRRRSLSWRRETLARRRRSLERRRETLTRREALSPVEARVSSRPEGGLSRRGVCLSGQAAALSGEGECLFAPREPVLGYAEECVGEREGTGRSRVRHALLLARALSLTQADPSLTRKSRRFRRSDSTIPRNPLPPLRDVFRAGPPADAEVVRRMADGHLGGDGRRRLGGRRVRWLARGQEGDGQGQLGSRRGRTGSPRRA